LRGRGRVPKGSHLGWVMFLTQMGAVTVEVSLKVAATKSSVTMQLKKICDTCVRVRVRVGVSVGARVRVRARVRLG
jgi:hypothetical protein